MRREYSANDILRSLSIDPPLDERKLLLVKSELKRLYNRKEIDERQTQIIASNLLSLSLGEATNTSVGADIVGLSESDLSNNPKETIIKYLN